MQSTSGISQVAQTEIIRFKFHSYHTQTMHPKSSCENINITGYQTFQLLPKYMSSYFATQLLSLMSVNST